MSQFSFNLIGLWHTTECGHWRLASPVACLAPIQLHCEHTQLGAAVTFSCDLRQVTLRSPVQEVVCCPHASETVSFLANSRNSWCKAIDHALALPVLQLHLCLIHIHCLSHKSIQICHKWQIASACFKSFSLAQFQLSTRDRSKSFNWKREAVSACCGDPFGCVSCTHWHQARWLHNLSGGWSFNWHWKKFHKNLLEAFAIHTSLLRLWSKLQTRVKKRLLHHVRLCNPADLKHWLLASNHAHAFQLTLKSGSTLVCKDNFIQQRSLPLMERHLNWSFVTLHENKGSICKHSFLDFSKHNALWTHLQMTWERDPCLHKEHVFWLTATWTPSFLAAWWACDCKQQDIGIPKQCWKTDFSRIDQDLFDHICLFVFLARHASSFEDVAAGVIWESHLKKKTLICARKPSVSFFMFGVVNAVSLFSPCQTFLAFWAWTTHMTRFVLTLLNRMFMQILCAVVVQISTCKNFNCKTSPQSWLQFVSNINQNVKKIKLVCFRDNAVTCCLKACWFATTNMSSWKRFHFGATSLPMLNGPIIRRAAKKAKTQKCNPKSQKA